MSTIQSMWQSIENQYNNGIFPDDQLEKIDKLVYSEDVENIRNGVTLITTLAPEYLCRYLKLEGESVVLRDVEEFPDPLLGEIALRVLVEAVKSESMWQDLYESGAFESMEFRAIGYGSLKELSESEKEFCVRIAKEMVRIPAGEFMMGALEDDYKAYDFEQPRHKVTLSRDFLIGKYAVTQALWESVMGSNPSDFNRANRPVEMVSWFDCVLFCNKLSELEGLTPAYDGLGDYEEGDDQNMSWGEKMSLKRSLSAGITCNWGAKGYRLPTEAEWEYAARGGEYHIYAGSDDVYEVAWFEGNSDCETLPVGLKKPNGFGIYGMSGNIDEWCWDRYTNYSTEIKEDSVENPTGNPTGSDRALRGGCSSYLPEGVRTSYRGWEEPTFRNYGIGFRICRFP